MEIIMPLFFIPLATAAAETSSGYLAYFVGGLGGVSTVGGIYYYQEEIYNVASNTYRFFFTTPEAPTPEMNQDQNAIHLKNQQPSIMANKTHQSAEENTKGLTNVSHEQQILQSTLTNQFNQLVLLSKDALESLHLTVKNIETESATGLQHAKNLTQDLTSLKEKLIAMIHGLTQTQSSLSSIHDLLGITGDTLSLTQVALTRQITNNIKQLNQWQPLPEHQQELQSLTLKINELSTKNKNCQETIQKLLNYLQQLIQENNALKTEINALKNNTSTTTISSEEFKSNPNNI